jgi:hypothetical protein
MRAPNKFTPGGNGTAVAARDEPHVVVGEFWARQNGFASPTVIKSSHERGLSGLGFQITDRWRVQNLKSGK